MSTDCIKVAIRARPNAPNKANNAKSNHWIIEGNSISQIDENEEPIGDNYVFDQVFDVGCRNSEIYDSSIAAMVHSTIEGFNLTVFAYGPTGSGKTYTMNGTPKDPGVIPRVIENIFRFIDTCENKKFLLRASYVEIYNEVINDLLEKTNKDIKIREDTNGISYAAKEMFITDVNNCLDVMRIGQRNRTIGGTQMNAFSSRSHSIFRIVIESSCIENDDKPVQMSHIHLIDLAGSERVAHTGATGQRFKEGAHINKSLTTLALVIKQLEDKNEYINYRDSKLTRILSNSLGGNAKTIIFCTVNLQSVEETLLTLMFAQRAKAVKNKPKVNEVLSGPSLIKRYAQETVEYKQLLDKELKKNKNLQDEQECNSKKISNLSNHIQNLEKMFVRMNASQPTKRKDELRRDRRHTFAFGLKGLSSVIEENEEELIDSVQSTPYKADRFDKSTCSESDFLVCYKSEFVTPARPLRAVTSTPDARLKERIEKLSEEYDELVTFTKLEENMKINTEKELTQKLVTVSKDFDDINKLYHDQLLKNKDLQQQLTLEREKSRGPAANRDEETCPRQITHDTEAGDKEPQQQINLWADQVKEMETEITTLKQSLEQLKTELYTAEDALLAANEDLDKEESEKRKLYLALDDEKYLVKELTGELQLLKIRPTLKRFRSDSQLELINTGTIDEDISESLKYIYEILTDSRYNIDQLPSDINSVDTCNKIIMASDTSQGECLEQHFDTTQNTIEDKDISYKFSDDSHVEFLEKFDHVMKQLYDLTNQVEIKRKEKQKLAEQIDDQHKILHSMTNQINKLTITDKIEYEDYLNDIDWQENNTVKKMPQIEKMAKEIKIAFQRNTHLDKVISDQTDAIESYRIKCEEQEIELRNTKNNKEKITKQFDDIRESYTSLKEIFSSEIEDMRLEMDGYKKALSELENRKNLIELNDPHKIRCLQLKGELTNVQRYYEEINKVSCDKDEHFANLQQACPDEKEQWLIDFNKHKEMYIELKKSHENVKMAYENVKSQFESMKSFELKYGQLKIEIQDLQSQNKELSDNNEHLVNLHQTFANKEKQWLQETFKHKEKYDELKKAHDNILSSYENANSQFESLKSYKLKYEQLKIEIQDLQDKNNELSDNNEHLVNLQQTFANKEKQWLQESFKHKEKYDELKKAHENILSSYQNVNSQFESLKSYKLKYEQLKTEIQDLQHKNNELSDNNEHLVNLQQTFANKENQWFQETYKHKEEYDELKKAHENILLAYENVNSQFELMESYKLNNEQLKIEIRHLQTINEELCRKNEDLVALKQTFGSEKKQWLLEYNHQKSHLLELENQLNSFEPYKVKYEEQLSRLEEISNESEELLKDIKRLESVVSLQSEELDILRPKYESILLDNEQLTKELTNQHMLIYSHQNKYHNLESQLESVQEKLNENKNNHKETTLQLEIKVSEKEELLLLNRRLENTLLLHSKELDKLKEKYDAITRELMNTRKENELLQSYKHNYEDLQLTYRTMQEKFNMDYALLRASTDKSIEELASKLKLTTLEKDDLISRNVALQECLSSTCVELEELQQTRQSVLLDVKNECDTLKIYKMQHDENICKLNKSVAERHQMIEQMKTINDCLQEKYKKEIEKHEQISMRLAQTLDEKDQLLLENQRLKDVLSARTAELDKNGVKYLSELTDLRNKCQSLETCRVQYENLESSYRDLHQEYSKVRKELIHKDASLERNIVALKQFSTENEQLSLRNAKLEQNLCARSVELDELKKSHENDKIQLQLSTDNNFEQLVTKLKQMSAKEEELLLSNGNLHENCKQLQIKNDNLQMKYNQLRTTSLQNKTTLEYVLQEKQTLQNDIAHLKREIDYEKAKLKTMRNHTKLLPDHDNKLLLQIDRLKKASTSCKEEVDRLLTANRKNNEETNEHDSSKGFEYQHQKGDRRKQQRNKDHDSRRSIDLNTAFAVTLDCSECHILQKMVQKLTEDVSILKSQVANKDCSIQDVHSENDHMLVATGTLDRGKLKLDNSASDRNNRDIITMNASNKFSENMVSEVETYVNLIGNLCNQLKSIKFHDKLTDQECSECAILRSKINTLNNEIMFGSISDPTTQKKSESDILYEDRIRFLRKENERLMRKMNPSNIPKYTDQMVQCNFENSDLEVLKHKYEMVKKVCRMRNEELKELRK